MRWQRSRTKQVDFNLKRVLQWDAPAREVAKLLASDGAANDHFGWSVSVSGNTLVIGSIRDEFSYTGCNGCIEVAKLTASDGA